VLKEIEDLRNNREKPLLVKLEVSLRSRPLRWISAFIDYGGLSVLLDYLNDLEERNVHDEFEQLFVKCLKSMMNNKVISH
jgi:hypothetical protein